MKKLITILGFLVICVISYGQLDTIPMGIGMKLNQAFPILNTWGNALNHNGITPSGNLQTQLNDKLDVTDTVSFSSVPANAFPTLNQSTSGNAATATKLAATKTINGVAFDGSADINILTERLQFRVDSTFSAPLTGDSIYTYDSFVGKHIKVYRGPANDATNSGGLLQLQNTTGVPNRIDGYRFNSTIGQIIFRPVFTTNEQVIIEATDADSWSDLSTNTLLDGLIAFWKLGEASGTLYDSKGSANLTTHGSPAYHGTGIIGYGVDFSGGVSNADNSNYEDLLAPTNNTTYSLWANFTAVPSTLAHNMVLIHQNLSLTPFMSFEVYVDATDHLVFKVYDVNSTLVTGTTAATYTTGVWYHIVLVLNGIGNKIGLYVNNSLVKESATTLDYDVINVNYATFSIGNAYSSSLNHTHGVIDEVGVWHKSLSATQVGLLYKSGTGRTYPFDQ
jgi:hypothetical protein